MATRSQVSLLKLPTLVAGIERNRAAAHDRVHRLLLADPSGHHRQRQRDCQGHARRKWPCHPAAQESQGEPTGEPAVRAPVPADVVLPGRRSAPLRLRPANPGSRSPPPDAVLGQSIAAHSFPFSCLRRVCFAFVAFPLPIAAPTSTLGSRKIRPLRLGFTES